MCVLSTSKQTAPSGSIQILPPETLFLLYQKTSAVKKKQESMQCCSQWHCVLSLLVTFRVLSVTVILASILVNMLWCFYLGASLQERWKVRVDSSFAAVTSGSGDVEVGMPDSLLITFQDICLLPQYFFILAVPMRKR